MRPFLIGRPESKHSMISRSRDMPLLAKIRNVSKYISILRYARSFNSSQRYLIKTSEVDFKPRRPFRCSFKAFEKTFDRSLTVNSGRNRNHGRLVASGHVNNAKNMTTENGSSEINGSQKENDDISLPFWIFLWSFLAIIAGIIYTKLNKQDQSQYIQKSDVHDTVKDEQIARKLVNEITKKDSGKQQTFRRQRSYEIIDGEVRIHYDVSMLDESLHKRANIEGVLKTAEVENIPIRDVSLDELELIYPGNLPRIVEEGEDELESPSDEQPREQHSVYVNEPEGSVNTQLYQDESREIPLNTATNETHLNSENINESNSNSNVDYFETKQDDLTTNFETISEEKKIPITQSTTEAIIITVNPPKDNYSELSPENENNLYVNDESSDELSSSSDESVTENLSVSLTSSKNSLHNSYTTGTSVYKLTEVEKSEGGNFVVNRREVAKLNTSEENCLESNSLKDETSFPFVESKGSSEITDFGVNSSQLSRDVKCDTSSSQQVAEIPQTHLHLDQSAVTPNSSFVLKAVGNENIDSEVIVAVPIENFDKKEQNLCQQDYHSEEVSTVEEPEYSDVQELDLELDDVNLLEDLPKQEQSIEDVVVRDDYNAVDSPIQGPGVLTYLEEASDILVDNTGDFLFKVIGSSVDDEYVDNEAEIEENAGERNVGIEGEEFDLDENENCQTFNTKSELTKNWKSLPSWNICKHSDSDNGSSDVDYIDENNSTLSEEKIMVEDSEGVHVSMEGKNNVFCALEPVLSQEFHSEVTEDKFNSFTVKSSEISDKLQMKNAEELAPEEMNEAPLLKFENKIGTRKTIFVRDAAEPAKKDENVCTTETRFDVSSDIMAAKSVEEDSMFGATQNKQDEPETLECDIPDEIVVAHAVELNEDESSTPGRTDDPQTFARASMVQEEDVLVAKIITVEDPKSKTDILSSPNTSSERNGTSVVTYCEAEINTVSAENTDKPVDLTELDSSGYTNADEPSVKHSPVRSDVRPNEYKISTLAMPASAINGVKNVTDVTRTTVQSIVRKFEEGKKPSAPFQIVNEEKDLNDDIVESSVGDESEPQDKAEVDMQSKETLKESEIGNNMDNNIQDTVKDNVKETEVIDHGQISEQSDVPTVDNESEKTSLYKDPNTGINTDSSEECTHQITELKPPSAEDISSNGQTDELEVKSETQTNNAFVVEDLVVENSENVVIYANQITELQATACEPHDGNYGIEQTTKQAHAQHIDEEDEGVIYANQVCETENIADIIFESKTRCKLPPLSNEGLVSSSDSKEKGNTTVVYTSQSNELGFTSQASVERASLDDKRTPSPDQISEGQVLSKLSHTDPDIASSTSPQLSHENRNFTETSFDEVLSTSSPIPVIKTTSPEIKENVFRGETDVDSLSDIDEIDVDVLPDETYQKSKSVTDLDEALASFEGIDCLLNDDSMTGGLSKSVPDILDSCREETLKETVANSTAEKLRNKTLSLSTPEIASRGRPGSKKVTKIKIIHVKFLETKDDSGSDNIEEDSFIYEGEVPISGKMKRRSRNFSPEFTSPVGSPPPGLSREIAQERMISEKTNLKQLEFEFGDLFQNSPSPPALEPSDSPINASNKVSQTVVSKDIPKTQDSSMVNCPPVNLSSGTFGQASTAKDISKPGLESRDFSSEINNQSPKLIGRRTTKNSKSEERNEGIALSQKTSSKEIYHKRTTTAHSSEHVRGDTKLKSNAQKPLGNIPASSTVATPTLSTRTRQQISTTIRPSKSSTNSKVEYKNIIQDSPSLAPKSSETVSQPLKKADSRSYRYTPGNTHSYSKVPKPVPEQGKYVVRSRVIATQSTVKQTNSRNITPQAEHSNSPHSSSPASSPRRGIKLTEKFHVSDEGELGQPPELPKSRKPNFRGSSNKPSSRPSGKLVTVKGGIISDYECSSDADSEMSYNVPSPRVKTKRYHRSLVNRDTVDSASSSEPDSPRRGQVKDDRRSMSQLFGVIDEQSQCSSDASSNKGTVGRKSEVKSSSSDQKLFPRFRDVGQNEETKKQYENVLEGNSNPPHVNHVRVTSFDQRSVEARSYTSRYSNPLERNLSPTSFLQEGNLRFDDQMSPRTMEFNPFQELEGGDNFQPYERCHSPSSIYSDTSSVFSFNCDFDPMPPPSGKFEPEVYTCENQMCRKQDILLGPEKTSFKSCPACFTYYCSSQCRKLHWPSHKQVCYFGRVNTYVKSIVRLCQRREDLSMYLSQLARDGYKKKGRGVVMAVFNSPDIAREFITKGHDAFSGRKPTYSSLAELNREGVISKHRVALMQAVRDYEPNEEFVFNIAVVATNNIPVSPAPRYKLNTVLHCIKMPLNEMIVARQPKDYEKIETRLFALPKCSRHEFVNEMEARRHYCRNLSKNLRQYNIKLKEDYPEYYRKLCLYVEHDISFEPMTVYGQRSGLSYRCVIAPEQSYPRNAEYC